MFISRACQLCHDTTFSSRDDAARDQLGEMLGVSLVNVQPLFAGEEVGILDLHQQSGSIASALVYVCAWKPTAWLCVLGKPDELLLEPIVLTEFLDALSDLETSVTKARSRGTMSHHGDLPG